MGAALAFDCTLNIGTTPSTRCFSSASSSRFARSCCCSFVSGVLCAGCALDEPDWPALCAGCAVLDEPACGAVWLCGCVGFCGCVGSGAGTGVVGGGELPGAVACGASGNSSGVTDCARAPPAINKAAAAKRKIRRVQSVKKRLPEIKMWLRPGGTHDCCGECGYSLRSWTD